MDVLCTALLCAYLALRKQRAWSLAPLAHQPDPSPPLLISPYSCLEDFKLDMLLYSAKASLVYAAHERRTGQSVIIKLYQKRKLSVLNM
jgi:hypothetical protein